ncbi:acyl-CoA thioesterase [Actinoplanes sp. TBRC 11911]|uniref:acyl-CoA thioesterase n=1 Tax=Actinoplanes sp. TBRC 11911 TaxID=2729386 RepID=UPI00145E3ADC|nr:hotdog domain-containing protein [Actinoplanes sp. TBRC 11911]NMO57499.1 acyl-CoA thioesterase [Actinoplanes sp. TBRC 11911]
MPNHTRHYLVSLQAVRRSARISRWCPDTPGDGLDTENLKVGGSTLVDRAVLSFWKSRGYHAADEGFEDSFQLVREITITFDRPVRRYGMILVHVWVERLGATSYSHGFRMVSLDGAEEYAHGVRTLVKINPTTQRSAPWSDLAREVLGELIA